VAVEIVENDAGDTQIKEAIYSVRLAFSGGAIPSWLAPFPWVQVRADFRDARAAEAMPRL
jgi:hypothetical protein